MLSWSGIRNILKILIFYMALALLKKLLIINDLIETLQSVKKRES